MTSATATSAEQNLPNETAMAEKAQLALGDALRGHSNSLGFIRLVLASAVIFDHAFPLGGFGADPFFAVTRGQASLGSIAVAGFFAISGYLIAKSGMSADVVQFMWRRFLRIFPAYWVVLLFTAFIVAPAIWITQGDSFASFFHLAPNGAIHYFTSNWTLNIGTYGIGDLLVDTTPYGRSIGYSAFNGSIWTLTYEWGCYLVIAVLVLFGILKRARLVVPLITAFLFAAQIVFLVAPEFVASLFPLLADQYSLSLTLTFMYGACLAVYSKRVPFSDGLGILSAIIMLWTLRYGGFQLVGSAVGVYFVLYLGARLPSVFHWIGARNDYSYGVYIYGFLVQQVLALIGVHKFGYLPFALIALVITFGFAFLSWHLVEKRAMALKSWGPGRGWHHWYVRARTWLPTLTRKIGS